MVFVEAKVIDSTHLELSKPIEAPRGGKVLVSVAEPTGEGGERGDWFSLAAQGMQSAYGDSEPEYELSMVKEPNPEFHL
ncbi:MAG: hypothetical protein JSV88_05935 [Candidatus Aminicenantes bacterium]|nr:MAG: hypothetical protein JSV88_05935 [Candidatus Aminicenantes bacterium]